MRRSASGTRCPSRRRWRCTRCPPSASSSAAPAWLERAASPEVPQRTRGRRLQAGVALAAEPAHRHLARGVGVGISQVVQGPRCARRCRRAGAFEQLGGSAAWAIPTASSASRNRGGTWSAPGSPLGKRRCAPKRTRSRVILPRVPAPVAWLTCRSSSGRRTSRSTLWATSPSRRRADRARGHRRATLVAPGATSWLWVIGQFRAEFLVCWPSSPSCRCPGCAAGLFQYRGADADRALALRRAADAVADRRYGAHSARCGAWWRLGMSVPQPLLIGFGLLLAFDTLAPAVLQSGPGCTAAGGELGPVWLLRGVRAADGSTAPSSATSAPLHLG